MRKFKICSIIGARPNFMKIAPIYRAFKGDKEVIHRVVHTGQHYDDNMSKVFFKDLGMPQPKINLDVRGGSHAQQTAKILQDIEPILLSFKPDLLLVVGDVNSTLACTLAAKKLNIPVAHVEAGLRSFDDRMPEEINRKMTDSVSDLLLASCQDGVDNLVKEGVKKSKISHVGNVMIDSLFHIIEHLGDRPSIHACSNEPYGVMTLHRPSNVDCPKTLKLLVETINEVSEMIPIIFPLHPRTQAKLKEFKLEKKWSSRVSLVPPLSYREFIRLYKDARLVLTDSGGLQEETTALNIPCLTLRENTERPVTVELGTNQLVGTSPRLILGKVKQILKRKDLKKKKIPYWDGKSALRIKKKLMTFLKKRRLAS